jgi:hypothetical protein
MGWTVRRSNPGRGKIFRTCPGTTTQRSRTAYRHSGWQEPKIRFEISECRGILVSEVNTQKLRRMLFNAYWLGYQPSAARQHFRNSPSLKTSKEVCLMPKQTCGSSYPISHVTSENWSLESKRTHLISYVPSVKERVKWEVSSNYGVFKFHSLKQLRFNNCGTYHFIFFIFMIILRFRFLKCL